MKLGLDIAYSGAHLSLPVDRILKAEALGFDSLWTAEAYGSDAFSPLAYVAALTRRIRLATGVAQLAARTPANCAMTAQTIEELAGRGRVIVGLGVSGPQIVEGWYGQPWGKPATRMRDYVAILRKVWRRDGPVTHDGREIRLPYDGKGAYDEEGATGLAKPLKSILHGNPDIPVMLGTSTPLAIRMTGEIADGWLSMHMTPRSLPPRLRLLEEGFARRTDGRTAKGFEIVGMGQTVLTQDVRGAIDRAKASVALYVGGMGAKDRNFHKDAMVDRGYAEAAERIQTLFLAGHKAEAVAAVPDDYIDEAAIIGPEARMAERYRAWADAGCTLLRCSNPSVETMEALARIARRA
ncbi:MAG TPA: LLM class F420-dependent oxidoreductase [Sphingobium sp.]